MGRVAGKVALISGGARGIGAASARALAAEGAKVVIGDILDDEGRAVADELGDAARYVHLDVTRAEDWTAAVETTVREFGTLNVLFNNAGIANGAAINRFKLEKWQQIIDVNLTGPFLGIRAATDALIALRRLDHQQFVHRGPARHLLGARLRRLEMGPARPDEIGRH